MRNRVKQEYGWIALVLVAALGVAAAYKGAVAIGLYYDDYHFVRPWPPLDLRRVWYGSWDPSGIESIFFRPLTAWMFAARFWLFGVNATAMHFVSVAGHAVCAVLLGWFLRRERVTSWLTALAAWTYAVYPVFPYAQVSWLTNQMHLLESLVVLAALLYWQTVRDRALVEWIPIALLAILAFLLKEDGVMLPFVLVVLTVLHSGHVRAAATGRVAAIGVAAILLGSALVAFRFRRLGTLGGYGVPTLDAALTNLLKGLESAFLLWPTRHPWQAIASCIAIFALLVALAAGRQRFRHWRVLLVGATAMILFAWNVPALWLPRDYPLFTLQAMAAGAAGALLSVGSCVALWRKDRTALYLIGAGLAVAVVFDLPFALVSKREQYHLLGLGAIMSLAGAGQAVWSSVASARAKSLCAALLVLSTVPYLLLARLFAFDFLPCAPVVLSTDQEARSWWIVPDEIREWLDAKRRSCTQGTSPGQLTDLPTIVWGSCNVDEKGTVIRWLSDRAVLLLRRGTPTVTLGFRRSDATNAHQISLTIVTRGNVIPLRLTSADWQYATVKIRPTILGWVRQDERVDVVVTDWFVPAVIDQNSQDLRRLGAEFRIVDFQPKAATR